MLKKEIRVIIEKSKKWGWVLEPDAQKIFTLCGFKTPQYAVAAEASEAVDIARRIGYPVVAKVVSPAILHKSDVRGVIVGIKNDLSLKKTLETFRRLEGFTGMLIAETVRGVELIIGSKNDPQFGPMILLGIGGIGVEIYKDVALRMAPLTTRDADNMIRELAAGRVLRGYRGADPVNITALCKTLVSFSRLMMEWRDFMESVDLNPVMCNSRSCIIADARILLSNPGNKGKVV